MLRGPPPAPILRAKGTPPAPILRAKGTPLQVVRQIVKEQVVGATTTVDKSTDLKTETQKPSFKGKELKQKYLLQTGLLLSPAKRLACQVAKPLIETLKPGPPFPLRRHHWIEFFNN